MHATPTPAHAEHEYRCTSRDRHGRPCRGFLLRSAATYGVLHEVLCSRCKRRVSVYLGGQRGAREPQERAS